MDKKKDEKIAVYDLGGGTFDISILDVGDGVFKVESTSGDTFLGGDDFDQRIMEWLIDEFKKTSGIDLKNDRQALQRLREASEKAKIELSTVQQTEINLPYITADSTGPKHLVVPFTRAKLEQLTGDLVAKTLGPVRRALADANLKPSEINEVVLVGGMIRMPLVQETVKKEFGKDPHKGVNPDEVVAVGAAIQAGVLSNEVKDILLLDVTPLTLSVETLGGVATPLIERNTTIPVHRSQIFSTAADGQTQVEIHVLQGERPMAADNKTLGKFILDGIPQAPRGVPQVEVSFDIDANGILNVKATDKATNRSQHITITASSGLSKDEVERMRKEAESHADEDKHRKDLIEARNIADSTVYNAEKFLRDNSDKVPADAKKEVEADAAAVKAVKDGEDISAMQQATEKLNQTMQKIGASMYQQPGGAAGPGAGPMPGGEAGPMPGTDQGGGPAGPAPDGKGGEDVVDGEFKNV
jgi:molecular chaperone DnaK